MLHIFDNGSGRYFAYSVRQESHGMEASADESAEDAKSFLIHGARHTHADSYTVTLVHTNMDADGNNLVDKVRGVAHVSLNVPSSGHAALPRGLCQVLPSRLRGCLSVPVTLLLTERNTVLTLVGGQVAGEAPLKWEDDLAELNDDDEAQTGGDHSAGLLTLDSSNKYFAVKHQVNWRSGMALVILCSHH
jgi:hypothetical protein